MTWRITILARRVHRLEDQRHGMAVGGVKQLLRRIQPPDMSAQLSDIGSWTYGAPDPVGHLRKWSFLPSARKSSGWIFMSLMGGI